MKKRRHPRQGGGGGENEVGESECGRWLSKISSWSQVTNGAPHKNAPLVTLVTNSAPAGGAPLVVLQKKRY